MIACIIPAPITARELKIIIIKNFLNTQIFSLLYTITRLITIEKKAFMIFWDDASTVQILKNALEDNQVILASGDTVLGLWANVTEQGFEHLNAIKARQDKPYLITIASAQHLHWFTDQILTEPLQTLIQTCWPGPVTLIFQARADLPSWMISAQKTVALRVPDHDGLRELLSGFDGLFSTSANLHGQSIPNCIDQIDANLQSQVSIICADREQVCYSQSPSTILDCSSGKIEVIRSGAYNLEKLKEFLT
jgi:L-threonylcarbamoyladenylate synthase